MPDESPFNNPNPYAPPPPIELLAAVSLHSRDLSKIIKDFRAQTLALGAAWIIFGALSIAFSCILFSEGHSAVILIPGVIGLCWLVSGIATVAKSMWGVAIGLVLSYVAAVGSVVSLNPCLIVIIGMVILQGHRILKFARQMQAAGLSLDARP